MQERRGRFKSGLLTWATWAQNSDDPRPVGSRRAGRQGSGCSRETITRTIAAAAGGQGRGGCVRPPKRVPYTVMGPHGHSVTRTPRNVDAPASRAGQPLRTAARATARRRSTGDAQELIDRELSWVEFNRRVIDQARTASEPLLGRLRFVTIVSSNFDEFFMIRVAALRRGMRTGSHQHHRQKRLAAEMHDAVTEQYRIVHDELLPELAAAGLHLLPATGLTSGQRRAAADDFQFQIFPALATVRAASGQADTIAAAVANLRLHLAFRLEPRDQREPRAPAAAAAAGGDLAGGPLVALVTVPAGLERLRPLPGPAAPEGFLLLEESIVLHAEHLFPGYRVTEHALFRVTRDADLEVDEATDEDFIDAMTDVLVERRSSRPVRLEIDRAGGGLGRLLTGELGLTEQDVYAGWPVDLTGLRGLLEAGPPELDYPRWRPVPVPALTDVDSPWEVLRRRDVLLHHPYESFDHVVGLLQAAAVDPAVLAIKMTLYRTSGDSPVVEALVHAAGNGKQVTVLVELKARFDEQQNIDWATRLERAGAIVVYGIARLKVHAKALLIVRREAAGVRTYTHLGTGNYNDTTARLYGDVGLLTARDEIAHEATLFFNAITGYSSAPQLHRLVLAPNSLKRHLLTLIEREAARPGGDGLIMAKLNALTDPDVIEALYRAARAGVGIRLNVRGVCMLRPGVPGLSENVEVVSILDRFLEHSRIIYCHNGGAAEVYLSSADWMPRNLERRVELMFPVEQPDLKQRLIALLELYLSDNCQAYELLPDGHYRRRQPEPGQAAVRAQQVLQREALAADRARSGQAVQEFTVRRRPPGRATARAAG